MACWKGSGAPRRRWLSSDSQRLTERTRHAKENSKSEVSRGTDPSRRVCAVCPGAGECERGCGRLQRPAGLEKSAVDGGNRSSARGALRVEAPRLSDRGRTAAALLL